jgi:hypothetical protein
MWLVLCHADDLAALWAYQGLKARGLSPVELVSAESLAFSLRWEHWIDSEGASFRITLADGRQIASDCVFGALNRIQFAPLPHWRRAATKEQEYVQQEMTAFYTSWLSALPGPVLNPATPLGLSGAWRRPVQWMKLAEQAGLATPAYHSGRVLEQQTGARRATVILVNGGMAGEVPAAEGCRQLALLSRTPLLGIDFEVQHDGSWQFVGATGTPDLRLGGTTFLDSLKSCLEGCRS